MSWEVEYTDEFGTWWAGLSEGQQEDVAAVVELLLEHGPGLPFPHSYGWQRGLSEPAPPCCRHAISVE
jgi:hypothetical protein